MFVFTVIEAKRKHENIHYIILNIYDSFENSKKKKKYDNFKIFNYLYLKYQITILNKC